MAKRAELLVSVCSILLGINALISTYCLSVELPFMIPVLPESWMLPSYLIFVIQAGNLGPIIYGLLNWKYPKVVTEKYTCYVMYFIGSAAALLLANFWRTTVWISGSYYSLPLFILTFFLGMVDTISSVVCFPYMAFLKPHYMTYYVMGEGLSGFLPTVFAAIQGANQLESNQCPNQNDTIDLTLSENGPRFSVGTFFYLIFCMLVVSWISFYLLNNLLICKSEFQERQFQDTIVQPETVKKKDNYVFLFLFLQFYMPAVFYGVLPSVQSYSCLPYGQMPFYLTVLLYTLANPLMAVLFIFLPIRRIGLLVTLVGFGTLGSAYIMVTAIMSPHPPFKHLLFGKILLICCWISVAAAFGYAKVMVASYLSEMSHRILYWGGILIEVGSTVGSALMFLLIVVFNLFHDEQLCNVPIPELL